MLRHSRLENWLLALLCVALLLGRMGGVQLHLCFDGMEPPSSVHLFDFGVHHTEADADLPHTDMDIAIAGDFSSKSTSERGLLLALLVAFLLPDLSRVLCRFVLRHGPCVFSPSSSLLRPPLRGPPLPTSC